MNVKFLVQIVKKASLPLVRDYYEMEFLKNSVQGAQKFISKAQKRTEEDLKENFNRYLPEHKLNDFDKLNDSYLIFDALEGKLNMQNFLPFFGIMVFIATFQKNSHAYSAIIHMPYLDLSTYVEDKQVFITEKLREPIKAKSKLSTVSNLILASTFSPNLVEQLQQNGFNVANLRILGSSSYMIILMLQGKAEAIAVEKSNHLACQIADLFILIAGGFKTETRDFWLYSTSNKKLALKS